MMALNIGIDLCDDYITAYSFSEKSMLSASAVICRNKKEDLWYIGQTAYEMALSGTGVLTDKLLSLLKKNGTSTIARKAYTAEQLISKLIGTVLSQMLNGAGVDEIGRLVIALSKADKADMDAILRAVELAGIDRQKTTIISHEESFIHYIMSQDKSLSYNMTGLFDLSSETLSFFKMKVLRGTGKQSAICDGTDLEEAFRIGILKNESGSELGDRIMTDAAKKCIGNDIYSSVFITGKGFERTDWAKSFIAFLCKKRKVMYEPGIFAIGAAIYADQLAAGKDSEHLLFCDTRTKSEVSLSVTVNEKLSKLIMIPQGRPWYDLSTYAELMPRKQDYIDIDIEPSDKNKPKRTVRVDLKELLKRPDRCTRLSVEMYFESEGLLKLNVRDQGFGEIFAASGDMITESVRL